MHYFETAAELSVAMYVYRQIVSVGEAPLERGGGPRITAAHLIRGLVVGDLLWVVVIAFLFAVITGVLG
jgi:hypothetical protein